MAFPSVLTGRHKIPGYLHNGPTPPADCGSSLRCRRDRNHGHRPVSREIRAPVEPDSGRDTRVITWTPWPFRTFRTIKRCPPGPNHDLAEPWVAVARASPKTGARADPHRLLIIRPGVSLPKHRPFRSWASPPTIEVPRPSESGQCRRPDVLGARRPRQTRRISRTSRVPCEAQTRAGSWALDSRAPRHSRGNPSPRLPCLASPANVRTGQL